MNHCGADCAVQPDQAEQRAAAAPAGSSDPSSSSSGASLSWPPPPAASSASFFRHLFADEEKAVVGAAVSSYAVDDLLLPPAATAFDDDSSADPVFHHLGAFPMVGSFITSSASLSLGLTSEAHTLEFVNPPSYNVRPADTTSSGLQSQYHSKPTNPRQLHPSSTEGRDDQDQITLAKKAKLNGPADDQHCMTSTSGAVDPSTQLQSLISKVNQSQSARSKEKLGERINALQQLVSPFGKTDTASVLSEAIGYIKFLQEQVQVLSSPYMKPSSTLATNSRQDIGSECASDLRSRGLCLVPVSCTMTVANNNNFNIGADYWASTPNLSSTMGSGATATTHFSASS